METIQKKKVNTLEITTARFGKISVTEDSIITMHTGMPGFSDRKNFIILEQKEFLPLYWYQCIDDPDLAFIIINPYLFMPDYVTDIKKVISDMKWNKDDIKEIKVYAIVNASSGNPKEMTANLMGPLFINLSCNEAVQVVFPDSPYSIQHKLFKE